jgi:hypothetical protein
MLDIHFEPKYFLSTLMQPFNNEKIKKDAKYINKGYRKFNCASNGVNYMVYFLKIMELSLVKLCF